MIDLSATTNTVLVPIEPEMIGKLIAESQYYTKTVIPSKTYSGINVDVPTLNLMALWIVDADQPTEKLICYTIYITSGQAVQRTRRKQCYEHHIKTVPALLTDSESSIVSCL